MDVTAYLADPHNIIYVWTSINMYGPPEDGSTKDCEALANVSQTTQRYNP
jgi:hypothetical protein